MKRVPTLLGLSLALGITFASPAPAQEAAPPFLPPDYPEIVRVYASGEAEAALGLLGGWDEARVRALSDTLRKAVVTVRSCAACPERGRFARFPLRAAILLHGDRELAEQFAPPVSEQVARCGVGRHAAVVDHLAALLILVDPEAGSFLKRFYLAMARQAQWSHCFVESRVWAQAGLKHYPREVPLLVAAGIADETGAFFTLMPTSQTLRLTSAVIRMRDSIVRKRHDLQEAARRAFVDALALSPDSAEAGLRLGRVLWQMGRPEAAKPALEGALRNAADPAHSYLAHLFLGRVLEDQSLWAEAETHYRAAQAAHPRSEVAAVALSHIRLLQGDSESARDLLEAGLEAVAGRTGFDPWISYLVIQTPEGEKVLAELRREVMK